MTELSSMARNNSLNLNKHQNKSQKVGGGTAAEKDAGMAGRTESLTVQQEAEEAIAVGETVI